MGVVFADGRRAACHAPDGRRARRPGTHGADHGAALLSRRARPAGRPRSGRDAAEAGGVARPGAAADPLRAHARLAVRVLSRRRGDHGEGPRAAREHRTARRSSSAMRTCRTSAATPRPSATSSSTSTTSTRRCAARSSGTSSASQRASRSRRARTASPPAKRRPIVLATVRGLPRSDARRSRRCANVDVWYARADVSAIATELPNAHDRRDLERDANARAPEQHRARALRADDDRRRRAALRLEAAADRPRRRAARGASRPHRPSPRRSSARTGARCRPSRRRLLEGFRYAHLARKVVGVGSVGMRSWIMLLVGRDANDLLLLQLKEAGPSVLEDYLGQPEHAEPRAAGRRRPAARPGGERHLPRLDARRGRERQPARLLRSSAARLEALDRGRAPRPARAPDLRRLVRLVARPRARAFRRPHRDRSVHGPRRRLRPRGRGVLDGVRRGQ